MEKVTEGVYFLFDGEELVYIGRSDNMLMRIGQHISDGHKRFDRFELYPTSDSKRLEGFLIEALAPRYNVAPGKAWMLSFRDDLFPTQDIEEAIRKYQEYRGDIRISEIADQMGQDRGWVLSVLHKNGAPIYKLGESFRCDNDWYQAHKEEIGKWI